MPSSSSLSQVACASPALPLGGFLALQPSWGQDLLGGVWIARYCGAPGRERVGTQRPGPSEPPILPLDCQGLLRDASGFAETKQGWNQVRPAAKDQAAASQGT